MADEPADRLASQAPAQPVEPVPAEPVGPIGDASVGATTGSSSPASSASSAASAASSSATSSASWLARRSDRRAERKQQPKRKPPWWELPALVLLAIVIAIVVKTFVVQPFYIPSQSMEQTLHGCPGCHGDRILVNKPIYDFRDPEPGDIVVFNAPHGWDDEATTRPPSNPVLRAVRGFGQLIGFVPPDGQVLVKRVIAIGGQTVKGDAQGDVMVSTHGSNGPYRTLDEPFVFMAKGATSSVFGPVTVPKGRLWVMGDHRDDSADSRFHCGPGGVTGDQLNCGSYATQATVPVGNVIGKAFVIAWPPSRWRTLGTPSTFDQAAGGTASVLTGVGPGIVGAALVTPIGLRRRRRRTGAVS